MHLEQLRSYALSLPETSEEPHFNYRSFRVMGKIFVTVPPDDSVAHVFVDIAQRDMALALHPECVEPLMWGRKLVGIRIELARARPGFVQGLVRSAWARKAPTSLVKSSEATLQASVQADATSQGV